MSNRVLCREASHAGSWYTASGPQLNAQLEGWLSQVQSTKRPARAIISLYNCCCLNSGLFFVDCCSRKIFILGPSHHVPLSRCALSSVDIYRTPLYDLRIDQKIYGELWKTGMFERILQTDCFLHHDFCFYHVCFTKSGEVVGTTTETKEIFGEIISGMNIIEQLDPVSFSNYLKKYHNTICGRHPIGVLLNVILLLASYCECLVMCDSIVFANMMRGHFCKNECSALLTRKFMAIRGQLNWYFILTCLCFDAVQA
uniref:Protein MEMO1 n=1 Tax=Pavo cristatus TaxID=9049 RepID=A0A8C9ETJ0_PAVCR